MGGSQFWYCFTCAECLKSWISLGHVPVSCSQFWVKWFLCTSPSVSAGASLICYTTSAVWTTPRDHWFHWDSPRTQWLCRDLTCWTELSSRCAALFLLSFTESSAHLKQRFKLLFLEHTPVCWFIGFKSPSHSTGDWRESMDRNAG